MFVFFSCNHVENHVNCELTTHKTLNKNIACFLSFLGMKFAYCISHGTKRKTKYLNC
jgi:hypothetical protein